MVEQAVGQMEDDILDNWDCEKIVDPEIKAELEKRFGFVYPYEYRKDIPGEGQRIGSEKEELP